MGGGGAADPPCHPAMQQAVEDAAVPKVAVGMLAGHVLAGGLGHGGDLREDRMLTAGFNITPAASAGGIVGGGGGGAAQVPVPFLRSATDVIDDVRSQLRDEKRINLDRRMKVEAYMRRLRDEEMRKKKEEVVRKKLVEMKRKKALEMTLKARLETRVKKEEEDYRKFVVRSLWKGTCPREGRVCGGGLGCYLVNEAGEASKASPSLLLNASASSRVYLDRPRRLTMKQCCCRVRVVVVSMIGLLEPSMSSANPTNPHLPQRSPRFVEAVVTHPCRRPMPWGAQSRPTGRSAPVRGCGTRSSRRYPTASRSIQPPGSSSERRAGCGPRCPTSSP